MGGPRQVPRSPPLKHTTVYWPIFGFYRYIGIGQNGRFYRPQQVLTKRCYIPRASRQFAQESTTKHTATLAGAVL